jgi:hypothetical protein
VNVWCVTTRTRGHRVMAQGLGSFGFKSYSYSCPFVHVEGLCERYSSTQF